MLKAGGLLYQGEMVSQEYQNVVAKASRSLIKEPILLVECYSNLQSLKMLRVEWSEYAEGCF